MVDVSAQLCRGSVYLAGEMIECIVTFTNTHNPQQIRHVITERLAWASVQIHCQCSVSDSKVVLPISKLPSTVDVSTTACDTSFVPNKGERGMTVLSTKPKILFCDLKLLPGESQSFIFQDTIPKDAPPSFKGQVVKYSYKLTIGTQKFNHPTKLLRIPFRLLVLYGLNDISVYNEPDDVAPSNPFLKQQPSENSLLDIAMQVLATVTGKKAPHTYNITNQRGNVAKFCLFKLAYKLGEDIVGVFDFTDRTVPCVQFSVTLQSEENISEECRKKPKEGLAVMTYSKHQEVCLHTQKTHICIPVPLTATPGFITDIVCLRWRLHFEFVTSCKPLPNQEAPSQPDESSTWQGDATLDVETMVWDLPIKVFPTNPIQASSVTLMRSSNSLVL